MKLLMTLGLVTLLAVNAQAQDRRHSVSLQYMAGPSYGTFNYDYSFREEIAIGVGLMYGQTTTGGETRSALLVPVYANFYFSPGPHRLFVSAGANLSLVHENSTTDKLGIPSPGIGLLAGGGYEYRNGFLFRAAPYLSVATKLSLMLGISAGAAF